MCGRFTNTLGPDEIARQLGRPLGFEVRERTGTGAYNIAPTDPVLTIVAQTAPRRRGGCVGRSSRHTRRR